MGSKLWFYGFLKTFTLVSISSFFCWLPNMSNHWNQIIFNLRFEVINFRALLNMFTKILSITKWYIFYPVAYTLFLSTTTISTASLGLSSLKHEKFFFWSISVFSQTRNSCISYFWYSKSIFTSNFCCCCYFEVRKLPCWKT